MNGRVEVPLPQPGVPDSGEVSDKATQLGGWFAERPEAFWTLVICAVLAFIMLSLMQRPFVRGLVVGAIILGIIALAFL
jgi:hypothetical protein